MGGTKIYKFNEKEFLYPSNQYRGAPFWAWNAMLDKAELLKQIKYFQEMGMGGFHIHSRTGLETEYLGEEFLEAVKVCVEAAKEKGMYVRLYDEDRWPSGFGGGRVTQSPEFRSRYLVFTSIRNEERDKGTDSYCSTMKTLAAGNGTLLECYEVNLENGYLKSYRRCKDTNTQGANIWYLYQETAGRSPWYNNETYADTLNPAAVQKFIEVTHEKYKQRLGNEFGKTILSIFTDEPQLPHKTVLADPWDKGDVILPYTDKFPEFYEQMYEQDFFESIPELIFETEKDSGRAARYRYHNAIAERFAAAYGDTLGKWCEDNNILLTGHMMAEESLEGQTKAVGEAMRSYRSFGVPGIDMLCDRREYSTAKQAQSAVHQYGYPGVVSEMYGATDWDIDFRGHKLAGDWQACLGVTIRVPHLAWYSMKGEAKRDLPASIFYQSPWYKEYPLLEDYFARINTVMNCGKPRVRIGVIHPIETYWLYYGPVSQTGDKRAELEKRFEMIIEWLLFGQLDFDFIAESLLDSLHRDSDDGRFHVGEMEYDVIVVPGMDTIRAATLEKLDKFVKCRGDLLIMGRIPGYIDGEKVKETWVFPGKYTIIEYSRQALINHLDKYRDIEICTEDGKRADCFLYQLREELPYRYLFIANGRKIDGWSPFPGGKAQWYNEDIPTPKDITIKLAGKWSVEKMDTANGKINPWTGELKNDKTYLSFRLYEHDSILLRLREGTDTVDNTEVRDKMGEETETEIQTARGPVNFILEEDNVLMLDQAGFRLDEGEWEAEEELLRIDNILRARLHYSLKTEAYAQPWTRMGAGESEHHLELRFEIVSEVKLPALRLAVEEAGSKTFVLNGKNVVIAYGAFYTDWGIQTVWLPGLEKGRNSLVIQMPYNERTNLEWCYLLGCFGVTVAGDRASVTALPEVISYGDMAVQGFPFYGGNLIYEAEQEIEAGRYCINIPHYCGALISVSIDGKERGKIVFSPYRLNVEYLTAGRHRFRFKVFGNRRNTFGAVHNSDKKERWYGPDAWRTTGDRWSYEYQLRPMGIMQQPKLIKLCE